MAEDIPVESLPEPEQKDAESPNRGPAFYCSWGFGVLFVLGWLGAPFTALGLFQLIIGLTLLPPVSSLVESRFDFKMTRMVKTIIIVACALIIIVFDVGGGSGETGVEEESDSYYHTI